MYKSNYNFDFDAAGALPHIRNKRLRHFETSAISLESFINRCTRFFNQSSFIGKFVLNSYNISNFI